jgi:regulatory protein spx
MSISQLVQFIRENPSVLKRPIMVDSRRIQVGYNEEEIRTFIPVEKRQVSYKDKTPDLTKIKKSKNSDHPEE